MAKKNNEDLGGSLELPECRKVKILESCWCYIGGNAAPVSVFYKKGVGVLLNEQIWQALNSQGIKYEVIE